MFDGRKCKSDQSWNNQKGWCEFKKLYYTWTSSACSCKNGKYLASIMDNWAIICDEIIDADTEA